MLGQPVSMMIPEVVGFHLTGALKEGITATDLVLTVTQMLRAKGVVGRFVEFFGPGVSALSVADRATIANMAPEYGATCGFFPIDRQDARLYAPHRPARGGHRADRGLLPARRACGSSAGAADPVFTETLRLDMSTVEPSLAGPKRPQDKVLLSAGRRGVPRQFHHANTAIPRPSCRRASASTRPMPTASSTISAMATSSSPRSPRAPTPPTPRCWSPPASSPARRARCGLDSQALGEDQPRAGLARWSPTISTSAGLSEDLNAIGFDLVGYGCTTCIGNSGPLPEAISAVDPRERRRRRLGPLRQPQFRGPGLARRARQLSRLAAAGRRLCAQGHGDRGHGRDADRQGPATAPTSISGTSGRSNDGDPRADRPATSTATCSAPAMPTSTRATRAGRAIAVDRRRHLCLAGRLHLHRQPALFRGHDDDAGAAVRHRRRAPARHLRRFASPPTTSAPPARSSSTARPANTLSSIRSPAPTSTPTAPAAAITR